MRVLIAVHGYPPEHNGGAERRAERTARGLIARGHDVRVVSAVAGAVAHQHDGEFRLQDGVPVVRIATRPATQQDELRLEYDNPYTGAELARQLGAWHADVVHVFSGYLLTGSVVRVALEHDVPVVVSLTDYWWLCHQVNLLRTDGRRCSGPTPVGCARCKSESRRRFRVPGSMFPRLADHVWNAAAAVPILERRIGIRDQVERRSSLLATLNQADVLIAPSRHLAATYARHGVREDKLHVWRQGVELNYCPLRRAAPELRFGYVGQIKPHKGVHLLLEAWSRLGGETARHLILYGSAAGAEAYARRIRRYVSHSDTSDWPGEFFGDDIWNVLAGLDVLVVPSRFAENSPNAILEAQAVGLPVVGANIGGIGELVQHEHNGLLFPPDDSAELQACMQRLLDEPELLTRLRAAPSSYRSVDDELEQLVVLYNQLKQSRPVRAGTSLA